MSFLDIDNFLLGPANMSKTLTSTLTTTITTATTSTTTPSPSSSYTSLPQLVHFSQPISATTSPSPISVSVPLSSSLPSFIEGDVPLCFFTMEACFLPSDDSHARFRAIVSALPHSILSKVRNIFPIALAASDHYVILKVTSPSSS